METYIGTKIINAEPMVLEEFNSKHSKNVEGNSDTEGYVVQYDNGYYSWSPKEVFESAYRKVSYNERKLMQ